MHITASVFIDDDEPGLHEDHERWLEALAPHAPTSAYRHDLTGEESGDAHLERQVMGREVVVAITEGRLDLGTWERSFYGEFGRPAAQARAGQGRRRAGARERSRSDQVPCATASRSYRAPVSATGWEPAGHRGTPAGRSSAIGRRASRRPGFRRREAPIGGWLGYSVALAADGARSHPRGSAAGPPGLRRPPVDRRGFLTRAARPPSGSPRSRQVRHRSSAPVRRDARRS
jgi:hypothetical protein